MDLLRIISNQKAEITGLKTDRLVTRKEEPLIDLGSPLAQVVIGVRRCGKSTLCQKALLESSTPFAYVNFDDENLESLDRSQLEDLMETLYRVYGHFEHLLLDEIQNVDGWPLFVNRLLRQGVHLIITGSNANLLSGELATHLTGRYNQIELYPFSFAEYCQARHVDVVAETTEAHSLRLRALDEYLMRGGFPELLSIADANKYALSLLNAIVLKDICQRYKVRYKTTLRQMANGLLDRFCQEISLRDVAADYDINSLHTAKAYLSYLQSAYLLNIVTKFSFRSVERKQARKCYATDVAFISGHDDTLQTENLGWRLENVIAIELRRRLNSEYQQIHYMRRNKDFEVDFVVVEQTHVKELIQVTYDFSQPSTKQYNREIGGLVKGAKATGCTNLTLIIMQGQAGDINVGGFTVHRVLATDWLLGRG